MPNEPIQIPGLPPLANNQMTLDLLHVIEHPTLGTLRMTGEQARNLYQPVAAVPAHPSLNDSHAGRIITSVGGEATVATISGGIAASPGSWEVNVKNPVFVPPTLAEHRLKLTTNTSDGQTFSWFGTTFYFVTAVPTNNKEVQIGTDHTETALNISEVLSAYGGPDFYTASYLSGGEVAVYAGPSYAGVFGNNPDFFTDTATLTQTLQVTAVDNDLANTADIVLSWQKNNGASYYVTLGDLCAPGAPHGTLLSTYRWPADNVEAAANLKWALDQKVDFYSEFVASYTPGGSVVQINELTPPVGEPSNITAASIYNYDVMIMEYSQVAQPPYVRDLVLGVLLYVRDGKACFSPSVIFRAFLSDDSGPVVFDANSAKPSPRLLSYADNGCVKTGFDFHYGEETYFGNGLLMALEEGTPGQQILVQRVFFMGGA